jgi:hypothetical protein
MDRMLFNRTMHTFRSDLVQVPLACSHPYVLLAAGLFLLSTQVSCERTSPTASQPTSSGAANSPATAASESVVGKVINFTADSDRYRISGWNKPEGNYAWSEGTSARLALPVPAVAGALTVKMTLRGLVQPPALPSQPVEVYANNQKVADWQVADSAVFTAEVPAELTKGGSGTLNLELRTPKAATPKSLGMNTDERILGVCGYSIEVSSAAAK